MGSSSGWKYSRRTPISPSVWIVRSILSPRIRYTVKQSVIADAKSLGIDITANDVHIASEDTEQHTVAENLVSKKIGVDFVNKLVTIKVDYVQHILGIPCHENVTQARIRSVQAPRKQSSPEMQQLLDATPQ